MPRSISKITKVCFILSALSQSVYFLTLADYNDEKLVGLAGDNLSDVSNIFSDNGSESDSVSEYSVRRQKESAAIIRL